MNHVNRVNQQAAALPSTERAPAIVQTSTAQTSTAQPGAVQTIALQADGQAAQAFFAVVTHAELQRALAAPDLWLNEAELAHWNTLRVENKRHSALQGRIAAKRALGAALGEVDLRKIEIVRGTFGQPLVRHARGAGIEVTLSHSHGIAVALAYPDALPMGIDLEQVSPASVPTVLNEMQLSDAERAWLRQQNGVPPALDQASACGLLWSAREALGKSLKTGLNSPLGIFALAYIESLGAPAAREAGAQQATQAWIAQYVHFPRSHCLLQATGARVLALALPRAVTLESWPHLP